VTSPSRLERRKAQTRQRIAAAAFRLFGERGFDGVTVAEIADEADVAVSTVFAHFPSKESLVFDEDENIEAGLVAAVRGRDPGTTIVTAIREHLLHSFLRPLTPDPAGNGPSPEDFQALISSTPALREYRTTMSLRHETSLALAIAAEAGLSDEDPGATSLARFSLGAVSLADLSQDRGAYFGAIFDRLARGWADI
jgi:AcrR family transcriptional regulator